MAYGNPTERSEPGRYKKALWIQIVMVGGVGLGHHSQKRELKLELVFQTQFTPRIDAKKNLDIT